MSCYCMTKLAENAFHYLDSTWLIHKKKFICAWTNKVKHFGHSVTSRVEGGHAMIMKWISVSTGDLAKVQNRLSMACENQKSTISQRFAFERSTHLNRLSGNFWSTVLQNISHHALNKVSTIRAVCYLKTQLY